MRKHLPGTKGSRFGNIPLSDHLPDPRYAAIPDMRARQSYSGGSLSATPAVAVASTDTTLATELLRIRSVQVGAVAGGTVTVQLQADGRDLFDDAERPVSGAAPKDVSAIYNIPAGTPVTAIVEADSGVPTGTANVAITTEPYRLLPQLETVALRRGDRLRVSRRNEADLANAGFSLVQRDLRGLAKQVQSATGAQQQQQVQESGSRGGWAFPGGDAIPDIPGGPPKPPGGGGFPGGK